MAFAAVFFFPVVFFFATVFFAGRVGAGLALLVLALVAFFFAFGLATFFTDLTVLLPPVVFLTVDFVFDWLCFDFFAVTRFLAIV